MTGATDRASYRVVQWATGNIGSRTLRAAVEHPRLDVVGVFVHSPEKSGRDAGELCGLPPFGVLATTGLDDVLGLEPDCVLYTPRELDPDAVCALLASGTNIVATRTDFHHPAAMDQGLRRQVAAACDKGGASIHSTGSSPGFVTEALPLVLASLQRRLDGLLIEEFADLSRRDSPGLLFEVMGFGGRNEAFDERRLASLRASFGPSLRLVADTLGLAVEEAEVHGEFARTRSRATIAAGVLEAGTVAAQRVTVGWTRAGRPILRFRATWYCTTELDRSWDLRDTGWRLTVDGDAPLDITIRFPVAPENAAAVYPSYTANRAVNAVPWVCEAPSGIRTTADLPQIIPDLA
ncbi:dihydrodipicolinate reductase [Streptomyces umbrinus]|uniref:NAD(P)H-dependent amine dehydrogenase family protein n=1 Tax=Streptomyces umbrinus TaxID=67370 RepID=UPI00167237AA|nr:dihydrodipicolinate reductase [Streptomyces umbrinus]GHB60575.1 dihydrodipicolinate reductase [Streptomyces umbrinus]